MLLAVKTNASTWYTMSMFANQPRVAQSQQSSLVMFGNTQTLAAMQQHKGSTIVEVY
jgi:hypothetical protein